MCSRVVSCMYTYFFINICIPPDSVAFAACQRHVRHFVCVAPSTKLGIVHTVIKGICVLGITGFEVASLGHQAQ